MGTVLFAGKYLHIEQAQSINRKQRDKKNSQQADTIFRYTLRGIAGEKWDQTAFLLVSKRLNCFRKAKRNGADKVFNAISAHKVGAANG